MTESPSAPDGSTPARPDVRPERTSEGPQAWEVMLDHSDELQGGVLSYEVRMAAVGQPLQRHLVAELRRQD